MGKWGASINGATALKGQMAQFRAKLDGPVTYVIGTPVEYSVFVELGTSRMHAQPYLRPAVEHVARNIQTIFNQAGSLSAAIGKLALDIEAEAKRRCPVDTGNLRASIQAERVQ